MYDLPQCPLLVFSGRCTIHETTFRVTIGNFYTEIKAYFSLGKGPKLWPKNKCWKITGHSSVTLDICYHLLSWFPDGNIRTKPRVLSPAKFMCKHLIWLKYTLHIVCNMCMCILYHISWIIDLWIFHRFWQKKSSCALQRKWSVSKIKGSCQTKTKTVKIKLQTSLILRI